MEAAGFYGSAIAGHKHTPTQAFFRETVLCLRKLDRMHNVHRQVGLVEHRLRLCEHTGMSRDKCTRLYVDAFYVQYISVQRISKKQTCTQTHLDFLWQRTDRWCKALIRCGCMILGIRYDIGIRTACRVQVW
jgi:hypothetical protein